MRQFKKTGFLLLFLFTTVIVNGQRLFTTSNKCYNQIQEGKELNQTGDYQKALDTFAQVLRECSAKDAKEEAHVGMAVAANGLGQYEPAIDYANNGIKLSKSKSVTAYYARSYAYSKLGRMEEAREDVRTITKLTTKNKNVKSRATMFANLAYLDYQLGSFSAADSNLTEAIKLDPSNPNFFIQQGDMHVKRRNYTEAFDAYDEVIRLGDKSLLIYQIRTEARLKQVQEKYRTTDINDLAKQMTRTEKNLLCADLDKAVSLGLRNIELELLATAICE